ncbi:MAG: hypothetical protein IPJ20_23785 [Flammeovirgaceae bacterium]|nr:hypothetical protein [Flammeovirgaceae bacterium]
MILENAVLQPCTIVGNDVFFWNGNHLGHHARWKIIAMWQGR